MSRTRALLGNAAAAVGCVEMFRSVMKADEIGPEHTEALAVSVLASTLWLLYRASERSNSSFWTAYSVAGLAIQLYLLNVSIRRKRRVRHQMDATISE